MEKSRHGEWRSGLDRLEANATRTIDSAKASIGGGEYNAGQCGIFRKTIADNTTLIEGVVMYRKLLDAHEAAVEQKLKDVRKQRNVAQSLYDTVSGTVDFGSMLQSMQDDFAAVMELELPDIAVVDDSITEDQINAISKMLDMN